MSFVHCLCLEVFVEKRLLSHLKNLKQLHGNQSVSFDQALDKFQKYFIVGG